MASHAPLTAEKERTYTSVLNLLGIFFGFIPSLVGYLVWRRSSTFVATNLRSALNFQLTMLIAYAVGGVLSTVGIGILIALIAWVFVVVFSILAFDSTRDGENYSYPFSINLIKG